MQAELLLVDCATCNEEVEIFEDDEEFGCPYCKSMNVIVDAEESEEIEEDDWEIIKNNEQILQARRSILATWCSRHRRKTYQLWTGHRLRCLICWPSYKPRGFNLGEV